MSANWFGTDKHPSSYMDWSSDFQTISGFTKYIGFFFSSSLLRSITITLLGIPIWIAARPMPGATYNVSSKSSINFWISLSTFSTLKDICLKTLFGSVKIFWIAIKTINQYTYIFLLFHISIKLYLAKFWL